MMLRHFTNSPYYLQLVSPLTLTQMNPLKGNCSVVYFEMQYNRILSTSLLCNADYM